MDKETKNHQESSHHRTNHQHTTEAFGFTEKELQSKDELQRQLTVSFDWIVAHRFFVVFVLAVFLVSGFGYVIYSKVKHETDMKVQDQFFSIEKKYLQIKNDFADAVKKAEADKKDKKSLKAKNNAEKESNKALPTGDVDKDYGFVIKDFNDLLAAKPQSSPAKLAALDLADIYTEYGNFEQALKALNMVTTSKPSSLVDFLVIQKKGNVMLSMDKFSEAESLMLQNLNQKHYLFLNSYYKLQLGLAYFGLKQWDKAEATFQEIVTKGAEAENFPPEDMLKRNRFSSDISAYEQAQKYLILLKIKKESEKTGTK